MPAHSRRGRKEVEQVPEIEQQEEVSLEETGLSEFRDGSGPEGISEVWLYRVLPTKKQEFVTSGPPSQFSKRESARDERKVRGNSQYRLGDLSMAFVVLPHPLSRGW